MPHACGAAVPMPVPMPVLEPVRGRPAPDRSARELHLVTIIYCSHPA